VEEALGRFSRLEHNIPASSRAKINMTLQQLPAPFNPFLGQPVEICIVTPNLKETLSGLVRLGIGPFKIYHFSPQTVTEQTLHGEPAAFEIKVAFAEQGSMIWEVMQPLSGQTIMQEFLDSTSGKGGIHHVAFDCADGDHEAARQVSRIGEAARQEAVRRRKEFEARGFALAQSGLWHGKHGTCEFMFFDTESAVNTCFESYVFSDDWEDPHEVEVFP
jgi:methylmalonyl-CoA/ethylmalonyl-CoA epimerase